MKIEIKKIHRLPEGHRIKAFVDVNFDDLLLVKGIRLINGQNGLFISMPTVRNREVLEQLKSLIIKKFNDKD